MAAHMFIKITSGNSESISSTISVTHFKSLCICVVWENKYKALTLNY